MNKMNIGDQTNNNGVTLQVAAHLEKKPKEKEKREITFKTKEK